MNIAKLLKIIAAVGPIYGMDPAQAAIAVEVLKLIGGGKLDLPALLAIVQKITPLSGVDDKNAQALIAVLTILAEPDEPAK